MSNVCLYHGVDLDGFCGGAIYAKYMEKEGLEHELIPANYGWDLPWEKFQDAHVTMIDFSMQPWREFDRLMRLAKHVVWLDHHKSAIREYEQNEAHPEWGTLSTKLDVTKAGCELAWEYYFEDQAMPQAVRLIGRYDVWDHADDDVLPFQYGMRLYDLDPADNWSKWADYLDGDISPEVCCPRIQEGHTVLRYQTREDTIAAAAACFAIDWEGLHWLAANRGGRGSKFFDSKWDDEHFDGMMSFSWNGETWTFGLYSTNPDIDCGAIAKRWNGGGHPGAAGFRTATLPFDILDSAKLTRGGTATKPIVVVAEKEDE